MDLNTFVRHKIVKLSWKPELDEIYYIPSPCSSNNIRVWCDNNFDNYYYEHGLVCKTREEAEEKYNKIIKFCDKEFTNGTIQNK